MLILYMCAVQKKQHLWWRVGVVHTAWVTSKCGKTPLMLKNIILYVLEEQYAAIWMTSFSRSALLTLRQYH